MQPFEWGPECSVHIPGLDAEHRQIIDLLLELRAFAHGHGGDPMLTGALDQLKRYADRHLEREELLLRIRRYPGYAAHKAEHDEYRAKVASLRAQLRRRDIGVRVSNFLSGWWRHHILTSDQEYARYFQRLLK